MDLAEQTENIMWPVEQCDHSRKCDVEYTFSVNKRQGSINVHGKTDG